MPLYRFYRIGDDGRIKSAENIECASDSEAQTIAHIHRGDFLAVEIWLGRRKVAYVGEPDRGGG